MKRVIIESPYSGDVETNLRYARACLLDAVHHNEHAMASHLLYTQILDDCNAHDRAVGMTAGWSWYRGGAALCVVYKDLGISPGMEEGIEQARRAGVPVQERRCEDWRG